MKVKQLLTTLPIVGPMGKKFVDYLRVNSDAKILKQLENTPHPHACGIKEILTEIKQEQFLPSEKWSRRIEQERERLLGRENLLADGSFEKQGIYDGNKTVREACGVSRDPKSALFLYLLTRLLKPRNTVELGTNVGISSAYIGAALQENGTEGKMVTLDASPYRQKHAKEVHQNLGLDNIEYVEGLFQDTLGNTLQNIGKVDLAFVDGHHQFQPTLDYFEKIFPFTAPGGVFIFDDIRYSKGMKKAWRHIQADQRFDLVIDLKNLGVCVCKKERAAQQQRFVFPVIHHVLDHHE